MTAPLGVGVVGCGGIARWAHLPTLAKLAGVRLVAAADPDPAAREAASRWAPELHADPDELLGRTDVAAVIVAVPSHLHADVAVAALEAGKHVYLEKPLAHTLEAGERVVEAARAADGILAVGMNRRLHPTFLRARALLAQDRIGPLRAVRTLFCESAAEGMPAWKRSLATGGGVLADLGTHHADLVRWMTGEELVAGAGDAVSRASEEDGAVVRWSTESGVPVQSYFSYRAATADRITLVGERGTIRADRQRFTVQLEVASPGAYRPRRRWVGHGPVELAGRWAGALGVVREPSYRRALAAFVEGVRDDPPRALPATADDGFRALQAVEWARP